MKRRLLDCEGIPAGSSHAEGVAGESSPLVDPRDASTASGQTAPADAGDDCVQET